MSVEDENKLTKIKKSFESRVVTLPDGTSLPRIGQGTWYMGENPQMREREIKALQLGIELGMKLIDTAEMYGDGDSERLAHIQFLYFTPRNMIGNEELHDNRY